MYSTILSKEFACEIAGRSVKEVLKNIVFEKSEEIRECMTLVEQKEFDNSNNTVKVGIVSQH